MWCWFAVYVVVFCIYLLIYEGVVSAVIFSPRIYSGVVFPKAPNFMLGVSNFV
jgi:hypothetical protein